ncbi:MAG: hypothetical protein K1X61_04430 [Chitinophagales bacterium]|nr:hypothetical protein [Chitinophagales bacterium]
MKRDYHSLIAQSALIACTGYLLSGPAGFVAVHFIKPQPAWHSSAMFAANYHFVQDIPYYFGLLLIGGMMMLSAAHYLQVQEDHARSKIAELVSLMFTVVFATLIFFNYICQTTFVRHLALHYKPSDDAVIAAFSMSNPMSLSWAVEMWGYGFLGVATWLLAEYYRNRNALIRYLLIGNGIMSVAGVCLP